jgi:hypothetical protein
MNPSNAVRRKRGEALHGSLQRASVLHAVCVLGAVFLLASQASADRISLLNFDGSNGRALRWRVAGALKRSGHTVVGVAPPKNPSPDKLRAFAKRRKVDLFIAGSSARVDDGWELALTMRDPEGEEIGKGLTISAPSFREILKELKADGQSQIDDAVRGGGRATARGADDDDPAAPPAADFAGNARALARKKKESRAEPAAIDLDGDSGADSTASDEAGASAEPSGDEPETATPEDSRAGAEEASDDDSRTSKATGWSSSNSTPDDDDGRESFLADESDKDGGEVGVDDDASSGAAAKTSGDPTVVLGLNAGFVRRTLQYSDNLYGRLRAPSANSWVYRLQAAVYPFARPVKDRIGLLAGYESEFSGVVRDNAAGTDFGVTFSEVYGGLKLRQPLGKHEIALEGTVGSMQAGLDDPGGLSRVPQFSYTSLRAALDVGLHFGNLALRGAVGYRLPIGGYGEASEAAWFPRMEGYGMEGSLGLEYRISKEVAFEVSSTLRRFLLQMNSRPEDARDGTSEVAGGAVDLYLGGYFGLNIAL